MYSIYDNLMRLCSARGISGGKLCDSIGVSRNLMTDLKMGRRVNLTATMAKKIADYFGVSVDEVLYGKTEPLAPTTPEQKEKPTPVQGGLTAQQLELIALVSQMSDEDAAMLAAAVRAQLSSRKVQDAQQ